MKEYVTINGVELKTYPFSEDFCNGVIKVLKEMDSPLSTLSAEEINQILVAENLATTVLGMEYIKQPEAEEE